jgi:hypothetical protein
MRSEGSIARTAFAVAVSFSLALSGRRRAISLALLVLGVFAGGAAADSGPVVGWGDNSYGQAAPPPSVDGTAGVASAIAIGEGHSCAIQAGTGAVVCWGGNYAGQATPPSSVNGTSGTASAIAAGSGHSLAIRRVAACADGFDNDGDGLVDHPADPDCSSADDPLEAPDADADGVADAGDNCLLESNPDQRDTDQDGYGNLCDLDVDESGTVSGGDLNALHAAVGSRVGDPRYDPDLDADGDGVVGGADFNRLRALFGGPPGPSGLACAGNSPCP